MKLFFATLETIGTWLLFIFPLYQAMLELDEQIQRVKIKEITTTKKINKIPKVSPYYWFWPPLKIRLEKKRMVRILKLYNTSNEHLELLSKMLDKATAWFYVSLGALFVAISTTYDLLNELRIMPNLLDFWVIIVVIMLMGIGIDRYRMSTYRLKKFTTQIKQNLDGKKHK